MDVSVRTELSHIIGLLFKAIYLFTYLLYFYMYECLRACVSVITSVECPGSPAVGISSPGTGVSCLWVLEPDSGK